MFECTLNSYAKCYKGQLLLSQILMKSFQPSQTNGISAHTFCKNMKYLREYPIARCINRSLYRSHYAHTAPIRDSERKMTPMHLLLFAKLRMLFGGDQMESSSHLADYFPILHLLALLTDFRLFKMQHYLHSASRFQLLLSNLYSFSRECASS